MKTNTLQNKLKKMQLFFKKSLLFEKIIISLHLIEKSSGSLYLYFRNYHKESSMDIVMFADLRAYFIKNKGCGKPRKWIV